jgi:acetolactate synthase-1/2/3 large subunit
MGTDKTNGISFPEISKIAAAYGIGYFIIQGSDNMENAIRDVLSFDGPVICEVICDPDQEITLV